MQKSIFFSVLLLISIYLTAQEKNVIEPVIKKVSAEDVKAMMDTTPGAVIVNFWASWCKPCVREIPWFDSIISKTNSPVKLLLISLDFSSDYPAKLTAFVKKQGYKGDVFFLDETNSKHFIPVIDNRWTGEIPVSIFINHSKNYYQLFNQQLPPKRFELELEKLVQ